MRNYTVTTQLQNNIIGIFGATSLITAMSGPHSEVTTILNLVLIISLPYSLSYVLYCSILHIMFCFVYSLSDFLSILCASVFCRFQAEVSRFEFIFIYSLRLLFLKIKCFLSVGGIPCHYFSKQCLLYILFFPSGNPVRYMECFFCCDTSLNMSSSIFLILLFFCAIFCKISSNSPVPLPLYNLPLNLFENFLIVNIILLSDFQTCLIILQFLFIFFTHP